jgi:hypothetical protein
VAEEPVATRSVRFPPQYGEAGGQAELLPWSFVDERLRAAPNYWVTTVTPAGRPHARPVDGVWVDGALCFGGSPETRWVRNLLANPAISVHLASNTEVVILEGDAEVVTDADHPLVAASTTANREKYPQYYPDENPPFRPFWMLRPRVVYAWTLERFPRGAARWTFTE